MISKGVSDTDILAGCDEYMRLGASNKNRVPLTPHNIFERCAHYLQYGYKQTRLGVSLQRVRYSVCAAFLCFALCAGALFCAQHFLTVLAATKTGMPATHVQVVLCFHTLLQVLTAMIRTGKFYPVAKWVAPFAGRGMDPDRAEAAFRMMTEPETCMPADVARVFFEQKFGQRYMTEMEPEPLPVLGQAAAAEERIALAAMHTLRHGHGSETSPLPSTVPEFIAIPPAYEFFFGANQLHFLAQENWEATRLAPPAPLPGGGTPSPPPECSAGPALARALSLSP